MLNTYRYAEQGAKGMPKSDVHLMYWSELALASQDPREGASTTSDSKGISQIEIHIILKCNL
jgi:hypothetical protein